MRAKLIANLLLVFVFVQSIIGAEAPPKCVLDFEVSRLEKKISDLKRTAVRLTTELNDVMQVFQFSSLLEKQFHDKKKEALENEINETNDQMTRLQESLRLTKAKRDLFPSFKTGDHWSYFYRSPLDVKSFEEDSLKILPLFKQYFNNTSLSATLQILVYSKPEDYDQNEKSTDDFLQSSKPCKCPLGITGYFAESNAKLNFVIMRSPSLDTFRHLISHVYFDQFLNPRESKSNSNSNKATPFLREGFGGFVVSQAGAAKQFEVEKSALDNKSGEPTAEGCSTGALPELLQNPEAVGSREIFASEAALFVRWINSLENGAALFRQLCTSPSNEFEGIIRSNQMGRQVPRDGFKEFYTWRKAELLKMKSGPPQS